MNTSMEQEKRVLWILGLLVVQGKRFMTHAHARRTQKIGERKDYC
jgi:hypothetical protein